MKKICAILAVVMSAMVCRAADDTNTTNVTQLELAQILVQQGGLARYLPADPKPTDYFQLLMVNGIAPEGGWQADKLVTRYDLARTLLDAMKQAGNVPNPRDPESWIQYCTDKGINLGSIGGATQNLAPLQFPLGPLNNGLPGQKPPSNVPTGLQTLNNFIHSIFLNNNIQLMPATPTASRRGPRI